MAHQCAAIPHTWCKNAKRPWQNLVLPRPLFPCPICAQRRPRITKSSGSCSRARLGTCQNAPRGFLPSHGLPPTMAAFQRKAAQLQIQLRGKPRIPTGFLLSARHAAQQRTEDDTMYNILIYYISHLQDLVNLFLAPNHKMCRGSRGLPPSCRGAGLFPPAALLYLDDMNIRQLIVRLPGDDIGKQGDIRILQPFRRGGDGDVDPIVGHIGDAVGVALGNN